MLFLNRVTVACDYEQSVSVYYQDQQMYNMYINNILYITSTPTFSSYSHTGNTNVGITPMRQPRLYIQPHSYNNFCVL